MNKAFKTVKKFEQVILKREYNAFGGKYDVYYYKGKAYPFAGWSFDLEDVADVKRRIKSNQNYFMYK